MDGSSRPIPAMPIDADAILLAALRAAADHGVPVKAIAGGEVAERTVYDLLSGSRGGASLVTAVSILRRLPEEVQIAAARELLPDIEHTFASATIAPAASPMGGACGVVREAAASLETIRVAAEDGRVTDAEAGAINAALDRIEATVEATRKSIRDRVSRRIKITDGT